MARGDVVVVRAFGGRALRRRLWDCGDRLVYVANEEEFEKLASGKHAFDPIGFPKEDVFLPGKTDSRQEPMDWSKLVRFEQTNA